MPTLTLHADNVGIESFTVENFNPFTNVIQITETWGLTAGPVVGPGIYQVTSLEDEVIYTFERTIVNNSGKSWLDFGIELFDPPGQAEDLFDADAPPDMCTTNCTPGSQDGLSMGLPPAAGGVDIFSNVFALFDYDIILGPTQGKTLDFFDGIALNSNSFFIRHGLIDFNADQPYPGQDSENQPFALFARINTAVAPEAAPLLMITLTFGSLLLSTRGGGGPRPAI